MEGQHISTEHNPYNEADIRGDNESAWDDLKEVDAPAIHKEPVIKPKDPDVKFESTIKEATGEAVDATEDVMDEAPASDYKGQIADYLTDRYKENLINTEPTTAVKPGELDAKTEKFNRLLNEDLSKLCSGEAILNSGYTVSEIIERIELMDFTGKAIFSDIDGTITDNEGNLNQEAVSIIKAFMKAGGTFIPVTGRARYESVKDIVDALGVPYIIINNGAEIFNNKGERIYGSEIPADQLKATFDAINEKPDAIWMQNKRDPETGEEWLYTNGTAETDRAIKEFIDDNVANEEKRIGLKAKHVDSAEVMAIPGQNYKIQIMSTNPDTIKDLYNHFQSLGIPCMLNMQSKVDGEYHWVEVIVGTKMSGIQTFINDICPTNITSMAVVGDGGNDLTMFKDAYDKNGKQILNKRTAVNNASPVVKEAISAAHQVAEAQKANGEPVTTDGEQLSATYKRLVIKQNDTEKSGYVISGGGAAIAGMIFSMGSEQIAQRVVDNYKIRSNNPHLNPDFKKIVNSETIQQAIKGEQQN